MEQAPDEHGTSDQLLMMCGISSRSASSADKADDTKWTVAEDAWTSGNGGSLEYTISSLSQNTGYDVRCLQIHDEGTGTGLIRSQGQQRRIRDL